MSFILFLLLLFLFFAFFVLTSVMRLFSSIFGFGRKRRNEQADQHIRSDQTTTKVFSKDEGEYVDFEEIDEQREDQSS
ncbi:MAG: DUF4834 family protein [Microbacter sp.]